MKTTKFYAVNGVLEHPSSSGEATSGNATMVLVQTSEEGETSGMTLLTLARFETNEHGQSEIVESAAVTLGYSALRSLGVCLLHHFGELVDAEWLARELSRK